MSVRPIAALIVLWVLTPASGGFTPQPPATCDSDLCGYLDIRSPELPSSNAIATRLPLSWQLTPTVVETVGPSLLDEQHVFVLGDALKNVSGLNVQNGSGVHEFFSIRGFDSIGSGLVASDGVPEPEVSYYPMYNVEAVEVLKGPAGFLFGRNPLTGVVNIVRKQPRPANFAVIRSSAGSFDTYEGTLDWNRSDRDGDLSFRLNGFWREAGNFRDDQDSRHVAVNPGLTWNVGLHSRININVEYVDAEYTPDNGIPLVDNRIADVPRRRSYQSASNFSKQELNRWQVDFERLLGERLTLRNTTYYRGLDWRSEGSRLNGTIRRLTAPGARRVLRSLAALDDSRSFIGNRLEASLALNTGSVEHALLVGLETVRATDRFDFAILPEADLDLDTLEELPFVLPLPRNASGDVSSVTIAPYVTDQMKLSRRFDLLLGVRYDYIHSKGDVTPLANADSISYDRDDSTLSPLAGLTFSVTPDLALYGNAAMSHAPPSPRLYDERNPGGDAPEQGTQFEIGVKHQIRGGKLRSRFAAYHLDRENVAVTIADGFTRQSGDQRSRGLELELAVELAPRLRTFFSYAYTDAELIEFAPCLPGLFGCNVVDYTGNTPIMAPAHLAHLRVSRSFNSGWSVAGGVRYIGEQFIAEDNVFELENATVLDASLIYELGAWRFRVDAKNITDQEYETRGVSGSESVIPADGAALYGSVEYRF